MSQGISYNKLWKLLIDKKMTTADLRKAIDISPNTLTKLRQDKEVSMTVLMKICSLLDCNIGDVCDFIRDNKHE